MGRNGSVFERVFKRGTGAHPYLGPLCRIDFEEPFERLF